jgi:hypothetical protein
MLMGEVLRNSTVSEQVTEVFATDTAVTVATLVVSLGPYVTQTSPSEFVVMFPRFSPIDVETKTDWFPAGFPNLSCRVYRMTNCA